MVCLCWGVGAFDVDLVVIISGFRVLGFVGLDVSGCCFNVVLFMVYFPCGWRGVVGLW